MLRIIERIGKLSKPTLLMLATGLVITALTLVGLALARPNVKLGVYTGEIQDSTCASTARHVERECALKCVRHGAKWVLYNPWREEIYQLDDQEIPGHFAAQQVAIVGTLDKSTKTIHVVKVMPSKE